MTSLRQPMGVWHEIVIQARGDTMCLSMDIFSLAFYAWTFLCFVHLPLSIKLLSILHSNALLGRLVYVLIGLSGESANEIKLIVTASYGYDCKFQWYVSNDHRNSQSTLNNRQSLLTQVTTLHMHGYVQFFVRTDHYALNLSAWETSPPTGYMGF